MKKSNDSRSGTEDVSQTAIDALSRIDFKAVSFVQLRRLNAALLDAGERVAAETDHRSKDDALGDTVRVAVPVSTDR